MALVRQRLLHQRGHFPGTGDRRRRRLVRRASAIGLCGRSRPGRPDQRRRDGQHGHRHQGQPRQAARPDQSTFKRRGSPGGAAAAPVRARPRRRSAAGCPSPRCACAGRCSPETASTPPAAPPAAAPAPRSPSRRRSNSDPSGSPSWNTERQQVCRPPARPAPPSPPAAPAAAAPSPRQNPARRPPSERLRRMASPHAGVLQQHGLDREHPARIPPAARATPRARSSTSTTRRTSWTPHQAPAAGARTARPTARIDTCAGSRNSASPRAAVNRPVGQPGQRQRQRPTPPASDQRSPSLRPATPARQRQQRPAATAGPAAAQFMQAERAARSSTSVSDRGRSATRAANRFIARAPAGARRRDGDLACLPAQVGTAHQDVQPAGHRQLDRRRQRRGRPEPLDQRRQQQHQGRAQHQLDDVPGAWPAANRTGGGRRVSTRA